MKTSSVLLALTSVALASANIVVRQAADATMPDTPTTTSIALSPTAVCLASCQSADVDCRAACVGGSHANTAQVDQTYNCIEACDKGDGSDAGNANWASCQQTCINNYYLPTGQAVPPAPVVAVTPETPVNDDDDDAAASPVAASSSRSGSSEALSTVLPTRPASSPVNSTASTTGPSPTASGTTRMTSSAAGSTPTADSAASGPVFVSAGGVLGIFLAFFAL